LKHVLAAAGFSRNVLLSFNSRSLRETLRAPASQRFLSWLRYERDKKLQALGAAAVCHSGPARNVNRRKGKKIKN
jgi:hypothetical protein